jgi:hypothetical protein
MANRDFPPLKASSDAKRILALTQGVKLQNRNSYRVRTTFEAPSNPFDGLLGQDILKQFRSVRIDSLPPPLL